jgi:hypothetical protein
LKHRTKRLLRQFLDFTSPEAYACHEFSPSLSFPLLPFPCFRMPDVSFATRSSARCFDR